MTSVTTSGTDRIGIVHIGRADFGVGISALTWGGTAMQSVITAHDGANEITAQLYKTNGEPPTASSTISISFDDDALAAICASWYEGASGTVTGTASNVRTSNGALSSAPSSADGEMGVEAFAVLGGQPTSPLGTSVFTAESTGGSERWGAGSYRLSSGSTVSLGWTAATEDYAVTVAASLEQAGGGAGTDDLTADDLESAAEVTRPQLGQVHALTADDLESAAEVTSPQLGQVHALTADDLESASEVTSPALVEVIPLTADDLESAAEVTSPALGQVHALTADDLESAAEVTSPQLGQVHALTADDLESASEVTSPALGLEGQHDLTADDLESAAEVTSPQLGQVHALTAASLQSLSQLSRPALDRPTRTIGGFPMIRRPRKRRPRAIEPPADVPAEIAIRPLEGASAAQVALERARIAEAKKTAAEARQRHAADLRARGKTIIVRAIRTALERRR